MSLLLLILLIWIAYKVSICTSIFLCNTYTKKEIGKKDLLTVIPEEGLMSQGYLWLSIVGPITFFFIFGIVVWKDWDFELSQDGFNTFIEISTLPLGFLSLSIPLALLAARAHATEQAAKQIHIADTNLKHSVKQFETSIYIQQLDRFKEYCNSYEDPKLNGTSWDYKKENKEKIFQKLFNASHDEFLGPDIERVISLI